MKRQKGKCGRRPGERLLPTDLACLKKLLDSAGPGLTKFCTDFYQFAIDSKYAGRKQPSDPDSVERTFHYFLSGNRSLPEWYWEILEEMYAISREDLPSRKAKNSVNQPTRGDKTMTDWLRNLPVHTIKRIIVAASVTSSENLEIKLNELMAPECVAVVAEKLANNNTEHFLEFYAGDFVGMQIFSEFRKAAFKIILLDSDFKAELFGRFKQWIYERSNGKIFSNITQFLGVGMRYWFDHSFGDLEHFDKDLEDVCDELGNVIEDVLRNIPHARFNIEITDLDKIPVCIAYLIDCHFINAIRALLHVFSKSQCAFLKDMLRNPSPDKDEVLASCLQQIKSLESNWCMDPVFIKNWDTVLDFLGKKHALSLKCQKKFNIKTTTF